MKEARNVHRREKKIQKHKQEFTGKRMHVRSRKSEKLYKIKTSSNPWGVDPLDFNLLPFTEHIWFSYY